MESSFLMLFLQSKLMFMAKKNVSKQCFSGLVSIPPPQICTTCPNSVFLQFSEQKLKLHVIKNVFHSLILEKKRMNVFFGEKCLKMASLSSLPPPKPSSIETKMSKMNSSLRCESAGMLGYVFHHTVLK